MTWRIDLTVPFPATFIFHLQNYAQCGELQDIKILFVDRKFLVLERVYAAPRNLWQFLNSNVVKVVHEAGNLKRALINLCAFVLAMTNFKRELFLFQDFVVVLANEGKRLSKVGLLVNWHREQCGDSMQGSKGNVNSCKQQPKPNSTPTVYPISHQGASIQYDTELV